MLKKFPIRLLEFSTSFLQLTAQLLVTSSKLLLRDRRFFWNKILDGLGYNRSTRRWGCGCFQIRYSTTGRWWCRCLLHNRSALDLKRWGRIEPLTRYWGFQTLSHCVLYQGTHCHRRRRRRIRRWWRWSFREPHSLLLLLSLLLERPGRLQCLFLVIQYVIFDDVHDILLCSRRFDILFHTIILIMIIRYLNKILNEDFTLRRRNVNVINLRNCFWRCSWHSSQRF